jgi:hypothetical protein
MNSAESGSWKKPLRGRGARSDTQPVCLIQSYTVQDKMSGALSRRKIPRASVELQQKPSPPERRALA